MMLQILCVLLVVNVLKNVDSTQIVHQTDASNSSIYQHPCLANKENNSWVDQQANQSAGSVAPNNPSGYRTLIAQYPFSWRTPPPACSGQQQILFYYEVEVVRMPSYTCVLSIGLSGTEWRKPTNFPHTRFVGDYQNSFAITSSEFFGAEGKWHHGAVRKFGAGNVIGCGVQAGADGKRAEMFFTIDGQRAGPIVALDQIDVLLYPAVTLVGPTAIRANFGDEPFRFKIAQSTTKPAKEALLQSRNMNGEEQFRVNLAETSMPKAAVQPVYVKKGKLIRKQTTIRVKTVSIH